MKSRKRIIWVIMGTLLTLILIFGVKKLFLTMHYSTTESGIVVSKSKEDLTIVFRSLNDVATNSKGKEIHVNDQNVWQLVEEGRFYFITYEWQDNDPPRLIQIEINDSFGEIYGEKFK